MSETRSHPEQHSEKTIHKLNVLRASVLGANDGIVSIAGLVLGVAGATNSTSIILTAGIAGIIAGSISMAAGEYVSVSSSRDSEKALLKKERWELKEFPDRELEELIGIYEKKGLSKKTATIVAKELTEHDAFKAHVDAELNIDPDNLTSPWQAAFASAASFLVGALIPLIAILILPSETKVLITFGAVIVSLVITGILSARVSGANLLHATARVVIGGTLAMVVTYSIGKLFGVSGI
ncbi:MAG TPA: VIT family protein [Patescibacteria group bacterium]|nr:VIT family protein [Patescibacteria group bacterium]